MAEIEKIVGREILDGRGNPTVEIDLFTQNGMFRSSVPSGASTGANEAIELRDGGSRYGGKGVLNAVKNVKKIEKALVDVNVTHQSKIDADMIQLDGTDNKSGLGANAILGVSMAACRAGADVSNVHLYEYIGMLSENRRFSLPVPFFNIINGGEHAGNHLAVQEFMIAPVKAKTFLDGLRMGTEVYQMLKKILKSKCGINSINVGDEGGFAPPLQSTTEALDLIVEAIEVSGYGKEVKIGIDAAASSFYNSGNEYTIDNEILDTDRMVSKYESLVREYPIISIEDPFGEEDWEGFRMLTERIGGKVQIIGDDLLTTNVKRVQKAIDIKACNSVLIKLNQIGTVTEALNAVNLAFKSGMRIMVSHRSGETMDSFISDLAVGIGCGQIKAGAPCRGGHVSKYNQLVRISEFIKNSYGMI